MLHPLSFRYTEILNVEEFSVLNTRLYVEGFPDERDIISRNVISPWQDKCGVIF